MDNFENTIRFIHTFFSNIQDAQNRSIPFILCYPIDTIRTAIKSLTRTQKEQLSSTYHEAAHALMIILKPGSDSNNKAKN